MKKIFAGLFLAGTFVFASAQVISFDKTTWDYGTVNAGSDGHRFFTVKNTGDKPLIISKVQASCGCTTPEWSQDPIMPGKSAQIKVGYNTTIVGPFTKIIEVYSNNVDEGRSSIKITGVVAAADAAPVQVVKMEEKAAPVASTMDSKSVKKAKAEKKAAK